MTHLVFDIGYLFDEPWQGHGDVFYDIDDNVHHPRIRVTRPRNHIMEPQPVWYENQFGHWHSIGSVGCRNSLFVDNDTTAEEGSYFHGINSANTGTVYYDLSRYFEDYLMLHQEIDDYLMSYRRRLKQFISLKGKSLLEWRVCIDGVNQKHHLHLNRKQVAMIGSAMWSMTNETMELSLLLNQQRLSASQNMSGYGALRSIWKLPLQIWGISDYRDRGYIWNDCQHTEPTSPLVGVYKLRYMFLFLFCLCHTQHGSTIILHTIV